jgi:hypothetical protein
MISTPFLHRPFASVLTDLLLFQSTCLQERESSAMSCWLKRGFVVFTVDRPTHEPLSPQRSRHTTLFLRLYSYRRHFPPLWLVLMLVLQSCSFQIHSSVLWILLYARLFFFSKLLLDELIKHNTSSSSLTICFAM